MRRRSDRRHLRHRDRLTPISGSVAREVERLVVEWADSLGRGAERRAYRTAMGLGRDFVWGSNSMAANQGIAFVQAYRLTADPAHLRHERR